eukprot:5283943-Pleurochrysis_carterae.AAC.2
MAASHQRSMCEAARVARTSPKKRKGRCGSYGTSCTSAPTPNLAKLGISSSRALPVDHSDAKGAGMRLMRRRNRPPKKHWALVQPVQKTKANVGLAHQCNWLPMQTRLRYTHR